LIKKYLHMQTNMNLISVEEARAAIVEHATRLAPVKVGLQEAAGFVLADDIHSDTDIPAFPQSSMD
jgi:molybdopterin biosynthesis enzyme